MSSLSRARAILREHGPLLFARRALRELRRRGAMVVHRVAADDARGVPSKYGIRLTPNWGDSTFQLYVTGSYGTFLSDLIAAQDTPFAFVDVGANQGLYSILAARNPQCARVVAFEPSHATADLLEANLQLNDARRVTVHRLAIADRAGGGELTTFSGHSGKASLSPAGEGFSAPQVEAIELVSAAGVDDLLPDAPRYVVKVDVEGFEETVLAELAKTAMLGRASHVFYEVDEDWVSAERLEHVLRGAGFTQFERVGRDPVHYDVLATR